MTYGVDNAIYCTRSNDGGKTFAPSVKVGEAGKLALGMRRGPRIAVAGKSVVITAVYGGKGSGADGDLMAWRSQDSGKSWKIPSRVNDVGGAAREGLHAMAASPDGTLACAWLDLRSKGTKIYAAFSQNGGETWSANRLVYRSLDGTVCECCHPSLAYDSQGRLYVMWRNALGGARDMYLTHSEDGGKTFVPAQKLGTGTWALNACPMDGGAIAINANGAVTTFWRRDRSLYTCVPGQAERLIGTGEQGWVASGMKADCRVWLERHGGNLMMENSGQNTVVLAANAIDPVVVSTPDGKSAIIVWQTNGDGVSSILSTRIATGSR